MANMAPFVPRYGSVGLQVPGEVPQVFPGGVQGNKSPVGFARSATAACNVKPVSPGAVLRPIAMPRQPSPVPMRQATPVFMPRTHAARSPTSAVISPQTFVPRVYETAVYPPQPAAIPPVFARCPTDYRKTAFRARRRSRSAVRNANKQVEFMHAQQQGLQAPDLQNNFYAPPQQPNVPLQVSQQPGQWNQAGNLDAVQQQQQQQQQQPPQQGQGKQWSFSSFLQNNIPKVDTREAAQLIGGFISGTLNVLAAIVSEVRGDVINGLFRPQDPSYDAAQAYYYAGTKQPRRQTGLTQRIDYGEAIERQATAQIPRRRATSAFNPPNLANIFGVPQRVETVQNNAPLPQNASAAGHVQGAPLFRDPELAALLMRDSSRPPTLRSPYNSGRF